MERDECVMSSKSGGHDYEHDLRMASALGMLGSIDCNAGQPYLGWDTDEFPSDPRLVWGRCHFAQATFA